MLFTPFLIVNEDESLHHKISNLSVAICMASDCSKLSWEKFKICTTTFTMLTTGADPGKGHRGQMIPFSELCLGS